MACIAAFVIDGQWLYWREKHTWAGYRLRPLKQCSKLKTSAANPREIEVYIPQLFCTILPNILNFWKIFISVNYSSSWTESVTEDCDPRPPLR